MFCTRICAVCWLLAVAASAQTIYPDAPDWVSGDTLRGTGGALVDLNRDGWLDFVVANGNDMDLQPLTVYYNRGDGTFPSLPDWQSDDLAYNGHLDVADVDGDGWLDVAVAVLGSYSQVDNVAKLYLNNSGTLSASPDWQSAEIGNAFCCAFGDVNNDGRPDLAVASGWAYDPQSHYPNYLYLNVGGSLQQNAGWMSDDVNHCQGVLWVDADNDGWLDLVGVTALAQTQIYANLGGVLETSASWHAADPGAYDGIMATAGDVNGDGLAELIVTDNIQLSGSGCFRQYNGLAGGYFETTSSWSYYEGYGSAVALADVDADGDLDLATGAWWDHSRVFLNDGTGFGTDADWSSERQSVVEKIVFADIDNDGLQTASDQFSADGDRRLFHLSHRPIREIVALDVDGLGPTGEYTYNREFGWICLAAAPQSYLQVEYTYSTLLDMAITNWDSDEGNYVYYNRLRCPGDLNADRRTDLTDLAILLSEYGCASNCSADLDGDGDTDLADLAALLGDYGCD